MVDHQAIFVWLLGCYSIGVVDQAQLFPSVRTRLHNHTQKINSCVDGIAAFSTGQDAEVPPKPGIVHSDPPMPCVHAVADGVGNDAVSFCGLIAMRLSIPGVGLFAFGYRSVEGVLDLVAFSRVRDGANLQSHKACEGECGESRTYQKTSAIRVHVGTSLRGEPCYTSTAMVEI